MWGCCSLILNSTVTWGDQTFLLEGIHLIIITLFIWQQSCFLHLLLAAVMSPEPFRYWNMGTHKSIMRVKLVSAAISISCFDNKTWKCFWHEQSKVGRGREMGNKREENNDDDETQRTKRENRMKGIYLLLTPSDRQPFLPAIMVPLHSTHTFV